MMDWFKRRIAHAGTPTDARVTISTSPEADRAWILGRLVEYNESKAGPSGFMPYVVLLRQVPDGRALGGLAGVSFYDWFYVEFMVIPEPLRHAGWGSRLLLQAEAEAVRRACVGIWLDTFSFQARGFYEKHGYDVFGLLPNYPNGSQRVFMRKMLV
jgi:GNAT superfamily N-acetyltransferase